MLFVFYRKSNIYFKVLTNNCMFILNKKHTMKKILTLLFLPLLLLTGCTDDNDSSGNSDAFSSSLRFNGDPFQPTEGYYFYETDNSNPYTTVFFEMNKYAYGNLKSSLTLQISVPSQTVEGNIAGTYNFGIGYVYERLVEATLTYEGGIYYIHGSNLKITAFDDSNYRLEFGEAYAVNMTTNAVIEFSGEIKGKFKRN